MNDYRTLKVGEFFYESCYGIQVKYRCVVAPVSMPIETSGKTRLAWDWQGIYINNDGHEGGVQSFRITEGYECYGPKIHTETQRLEYLRGVEVQLAKDAAENTVH